MFAFCKATDKEKVGTSRQVAWINGAKLVAILAVLVDHTNGVLYINQEFALASYFSVALFVLLSGMTSYMTNANGKDVSGGGIYETVKNNGCIQFGSCSIFGCSDTRI